MPIKLVVATLDLGSRLRQGLARVQIKKETQESHLMLLGNAGKCEGMTPQTPK
jgi:hypothetical protein